MIPNFNLPGYGPAFTPYQPLKMPGFDVPQVTRPTPNFNFGMPSTPGMNPQGQGALEEWQQQMGQLEPAPDFEPPNPIMIPKLNPWILAAMGIASLMDRTGQVGTNLGQGLLQGGQMRSQNEAEKRRAQVMAAQGRRQEQMRNAETVYRHRAQIEEEARRAAAGLESDERKFTQQKEIEGMRQQGMTDRANLNHDAKALSDAIRAVSSRYTVQREAALGMLLDWGRIDDATYNRMLPIVQRETAGERVEGTRATLNQSQVGWTDAKTKTEDALRTPKVLKVQADTQLAMKRAGLTDSQKKLVDKKVANYDLEFKVKAANIYSQIEKRKSDMAKGVDPRKAEDQTIADLNRLIGIAKSQIAGIDKQYPTPESDKRKADLEAELADLQSQVQGIVKGRQSRTGATNLQQEIETARRYIQEGADPAKVKARFKERTGTEFPG